MLLYDKIPAHVGVIMDGNGRWAEVRGFPRIEGHRRGAERAKEIVTAANEIGVRVLTLYTFSLENWQRPKDEVTTLMKILEIYLRNEFNEFMEKKIVFKAIGEIWMLPENVQELIAETEQRTAANTGMTLVAALSYGGRNEIIRAVKRIISENVNPDDITEDFFESFLDTAGIPSPDLIIRTSGERRVSNFLLWQGAYSEFYFTETLWPDFTKDEFMAALNDYQTRERRFGAVPARVKS
ncbi:MAG: di-trans,poly-cis-decaprenylcistransferase [Nitrospirae bacterium CG_4_10_14_3_um_filter_44_29]|nr:isoprenyl transferase [Nitrospirota bacterium]OIO32167.1 MAG: di-trans,poly-cis-decaprenylcistransferase [Nitrospirae bacterium CG1_02_44_142]PIP70899.1 MAG: di-trans,poly-cis-decaprenylcistransferase [Nitrospirae bacterium CG22_combo_CG10-13_8_21_14_all_44_11]PIV40604.1 MAG: di-trans,poly-cis-decaprenylcistransferase [Nitrospirae bacterium CG02_land_8_20_14_3_00_44_33]PIV66614.1 MAG: di-trans,poly-cis-decaprenylcistransferase [Nitrospirae bacterium CG01_land_8_20_14_3_00_44_22]PIW88440.1 M